MFRVKLAQQRDRLRGVVGVKEHLDPSHLLLTQILLRSLLLASLVVWAVAQQAPAAPDRSGEALFRAVLHDCSQTKNLRAVVGRYDENDRADGVAESVVYELLYRKRAVSRHTSTGVMGDGSVIVCDTYEEMVEVADRIASEHVQVMTRDSPAVQPETSVKDAVALLIDRKYGALPVVDGDELVGIISDIDMLRVVHTML